MSTVIKSVLELFPFAEIDNGISEELAQTANQHIEKTSGLMGGTILLGPQDGLKVIEVNGVVQSAELDDQQATRDVLLWPATDRQALEAGSRWVRQPEVYVLVCCSWQRISMCAGCSAKLE